MDPKSGNVKSPHAGRSATIIWLNAFGPGSKRQPTRKQWALHLAHKGFEIARLKAGAKEPLPGVSWTAEATRDPAVIRQWFAETPDMNYLVHPGERYVILDLDMKGGANGIGALARHLGIDDLGMDQEELAKLTLAVATPSGGMHLFCRADRPYGNRTRILGSIDVRGYHGYVVGPGCKLIEGQCKDTDTPGDYTVLNYDGSLLVLPPSIAELLAHRDATGHKAPDGIEVDRADNLVIARAFIRDDLARNGPPVEGQGSDERAYKLVAALRDLALSDEAVLDLLTTQWAPHFDREWIEAKVANADAYAQNDPGAHASTKTSAGVFGPAAERIAQQEQASPSPATPTPPDDLVARFRGREPDEDEALPELVFWDEERTLPRSPEGAVVVDYGPPGAFKTARALSEAFTLTKAGARVVYVVGEGAHGVRKLRLPALCKEHGITTRELRGKWRTVGNIPLLTDPEQVMAFIAAHMDRRPDVIYLDTMAAAAGDVDENAAAFGQLLTSNGPIGAIRKALGCLVVIIHHSGKDLARGSRGHSSLKGNADGLRRITADKTTRIINMYAEKMRDAEDGFTVEYKVPPPGQIPVVTKIGRVANIRLSPEASAEMEKARGFKREVIETLFSMYKSGMLPASVPDVAQTLNLRRHDYRQAASDGDLQKRIAADVQRIQRGIRGTKGKGQRSGMVGSLRDLVRLDHRGEPFTPYEMILPEEYLREPDADGSAG